MQYLRGNVNRSFAIAEIRTLCYDYKTDSTHEETFEVETSIRSHERVRRLLNRQQKGRFIIFRVLDIKFINVVYSLSIEDFMKYGTLISQEVEDE